MLASHPGVADVCVTGRPDPEWGERMVAYVVPRDPSAPALARRDARLRPRSPVCPEAPT
ncbi:MAG: hypothetical protein HYU28_03975 [Actinobacteria bacterium]|nr:hypothetical protein [Actinomycetota bacterium]